jgi:hypothetical protein
MIISKEIDDLLEIDSSLDSNETESLIPHIAFRFLLPFLIAGIGSIYIDQFNGGYGALFLIAGLVCISLLYVFFEMIYFSINDKKRLAKANLKVFGLWILCISITLIFVWFFD